MYYKLLGCKILEREIASVIYSCKNVIDVTMIRQRLHDTPERLHEILQQEITLIDENRHHYSNDTCEHDFDAILLGYGLCSNVVVGLTSSRYPLVIPKAHDCVTLLMGDKEKYLEYYKKNPGTFYYSPGFTELYTLDEEDRLRRRYQMYLTRYHGNEKKAQKAVKIEAEFTKNYRSAAYISWEGFSFPEYEEQACLLAKEKNWTYEKIPGNNSLLKHLVDGEWSEERFLIVRPGYHAEPSYDEEILMEVTNVQQK